MTRIDPVAVDRVGDVGPAEGRSARAAAFESRIEPATLEGALPDSTLAAVAGAPGQDAPSAPARARGPGERKARTAHGVCLVAGVSSRRQTAGRTSPARASTRRGLRVRGTRRRGVTSSPGRRGAGQHPQIAVAGLEPDIPPRPSPFQVVDRPLAAPPNSEQLVSTPFAVRPGTPGAQNEHRKLPVPAPVATSTSDPLRGPTASGRSRSGGDLSFGLDATAATPRLLAGARTAAKSAAPRTVAPRPRSSAVRREPARTRARPFPGRGRLAGKSPRSNAATPVLDTALDNGGPVPVDRHPDRHQVNGTPVIRPTTGRGDPRRSSRPTPDQGPAQGGRAVRPRESYVRMRRRLSDAGGGARGPARSTGCGGQQPGVVVESKPPLPGGPVDPAAGPREVLLVAGAV